MQKACTLLLQVVERQLQAFQHNYEQTSERQQYTPEMLDRGTYMTKQCIGQLITPPQLQIQCV